jgi:hypothetical protein
MWRAIHVADEAELLDVLSASQWQRQWNQLIVAECVDWKECERLSVSMRRSRPRDDGESARLTRLVVTKTEPDSPLLVRSSLNLRSG